MSAAERPGPTAGHDLGPGAGPDGEPQLRLTVLGSSGTYGAADNPCSGYLVRSATTTVVLDCGPGTLSALQRHVDLTQVDAVVVSHEHPDHWLELPLFRHAWRYGWTSVREERVPLITTTGVTRLADGLTERRILRDTFEATVVGDGRTVTLGDLELSFSRTAHPVETLAVRVDGPGGTSLGYTADTGPDWPVGRLGTGLGLLVAEATFLESDGLTGMGAVHMTAAEAGAAAADAAAERLAVTHVLPGRSWSEAVAEATDAYGAPVETAGPGTTFQLPAPTRPT